MIGLALLIGGRGVRLGGVDKASLALAGGGTTGEAVLATFGPLVGEAFAVGRSDQTSHPLSRSVKIVVDGRPDEGPLRGIATALAAARADWLFVVACDLVGLVAGDLTELAGERGRGRLALAWRSIEGTEPLCALYHRSMARVAEALLARGERRARALLEGAGVKLVKRASPLLNVNTAEELARVS